MIFDSSYSMRLIDPDDVDVVERLPRHLWQQASSVRVVHDGRGTVMFLSKGPAALLLDDVREALEVGLGTWTEHLQPPHDLAVPAGAGTRRP